MAREKPEAWRCEHRYPIAVEEVGGAERARCLGCGAGGPLRAGAGQAMLALRAEAQAGQGLGAQPPARRPPDHIRRAMFRELRPEGVLGTSALGGSKKSVGGGGTRGPVFKIGGRW